MLPRKERRKADVVMSSALMLFGCFVIYQGSQMPWAMTRVSGTSQWFLSPGLFPVVLGGMLILFSARVLATAVGDGGHIGIWSGLRGWFRKLPVNRHVHRLVFMILWIGLYIFVGIGRVNFQLVSAIFLFGFIAAFWLTDAPSLWKRRIVVTLAVAVLVPFTLSYIFSTFLYVPVP